MKIIDTIYTNSPVFLQNAFLSAYGYKLKKTRYGKKFKSHVKKIQNYDYSAGKVASHQNIKLRSILQYSEKHVPFYQELVSKNRIDVKDICLDNFSARWPILEKEGVSENQKNFYSTALSARSTFTLNTSGTSGAPLDIRATADAIQYNYAFFDLFLKSIGLSEFDRSATFAGRLIVPMSDDSGPFWRINLTMNTMLCSSYHLSEKNIPLYIAALARWKPTYIDSYPSAIYQIASYIVGNNISHNIRLKAIITSSETLTSLQRYTIELAFGCKIYDQYGCAEMVVTAYQNTEFKYFVNPYYSIVEVLDDYGLPVLPGESGSLVCTGLLNNAMPLIRYRIGDYVKTSNVEPVGPHWLFLDSIEGRMDDVIITPEGNKIGRLDPAFKGISCIKNAQIIQEHLDQIVVNVVKFQNYDDVSENELRHELQLRLGPSMKICFNYLDEIPTQKNGKFKSVISLLDSKISTPASEG